MRRRKITTKKADLTISWLLEKISGWDPISRHVDKERKETAGLNHIDALGGKRRYALSILPRESLVLNFYLFRVIIFMHPL